MQREVGHLAARDPRRAFDEVGVIVAGDDQLRKRNSVLEPERVHCRDGNLLRFRERVREQP